MNIEPKPYFFYVNTYTSYRAKMTECNSYLHCLKTYTS